MIRTTPPSLALLALLSIAGCGGTSHHSGVDPVLQRELIEEARAEEHYESQSEEERAEESAMHENERRLRVMENRVFEACYDDLQHLDEATRRRRHHRWRRMNELEMAEEGVGPSMTREANTASRPSGDGAHHEVSNVDPHATPTPFGEDEERLIELENRYDSFRREHPHPATWQSAQLVTLDDLGDALLALCDAQRANIR